MKQKHTILYVDDEPINLQLFELNFERDYKIFTAISGKEGLSILEKHPKVCVVLSDMRMPQMNGLEFIKIAKEKFPEICYFILTSFDITEEISAAIEGKLINKYLSKPFNVVEIKEAINENTDQGCR